MSVNLIEAVQRDLGYPPLHKIDPNAQKKDEPVEKAHAPDQFSQAAIPAVLTGFYRYVQSDEGAEDFLRGDNSTNWVSKIFDDHSKDAVQAISAYAEGSGTDPVAKMNEIADTSVKLVKQDLPSKAGIKELKVLFSHQRNNILLYLPPALNMGELLHDNVLDDNVNKMEGPVSSLIKNIGSAFSNPVTSEEINKS